VQSERLASMVRQVGVSVARANVKYWLANDWKKNKHVAVRQHPNGGYITSSLAR
jgi:hypothetical protein